MEYIDRFGLLGPQMTLGHGVWLNERDIERLAETGTCVCHNCSSNFRLRSGVAALNKLEAAGITTAIGIDEAGINDDRDMLQEMRMVLRAHRVPGMDDEVPTPAQVFRMATSRGAATTPFADTIGALEVGRAADMVLIDWREISYPYLDPETPLLDAVLQRAKTSGVRTVICDGDVITTPAGSPRSTATARSRRCTRTCNERSPTTRSNVASSPSHCCRMCTRSMPITSTPSSTCPFTGRVPDSKVMLRRARRCTLPRLRCRKRSCKSGE